MENAKSKMEWEKERQKKKIKLYEKRLVEENCCVKGETVCYSIFLLNVYALQIIVGRLCMNVVPASTCTSLAYVIIVVLMLLIDIRRRN